MDIAMLGLGRMGGNMARRLLRGGHRGGGGVAPLRRPPRHTWIMLPAGEVTESALQALMGVLSPGDTIIEGGNSNYKDTQRRAAMVEAQGLNYVDVGVSGGVWGLANGYGMLVGGEKEAVERMRPIFETLAPALDKGWGHLGPHGAGHYAKMVHN